VLEQSNLIERLRHAANVVAPNLPKARASDLESQGLKAGSQVASTEGQNVDQPVGVGTRLLRVKKAQEKIKVLLRLL
jgi:hypothetical protein